MKRERTYVIITLAATVIINIIGLFIGKDWNLTFYFFIPILLLILIYFLLVSQMLNMENRLFEKMRSISPGFEYITGEEFVKRTLIETINEAKELICTTGGKAREEDYLQCLNKKVLIGNVKYYRVILGDHIQHSFHEHLKELINGELDSVYIGHQLEEKYGNMLITDDEVILYLPSPTFKGLDRVLKISDPNLAKKYQIYIIQIYSESKRITTNADLSKLCIECRHA